MMPGTIHHRIRLFMESKKILRFVFVQQNTHGLLANAVEITSTIVVSLLKQPSYGRVQGKNYLYGFASLW